MRRSLIDRILAGPPIRLRDIQPGNRVQGFEGWGCVPDNAARTVRCDATGLFVSCRCGRHYLAGQEGDDGTLLGMVKAAA